MLEWRCAGKITYTKTEQSTILSQIKTVAHTSSEDHSEIDLTVISVSSVSVAGVDLPVADDIKVLGVGARSASDVPQTRVGGGAIVQLPCTGHPTHSTPADYGTGTDTGL